MFTNGRTDEPTDGQRHAIIRPFFFFFFFFLKRAYKKLSYISDIVEFSLLSTFIFHEYVHVDKKRTTKNLPNQS